MSRGNHWYIVILLAAIAALFVGQGCTVAPPPDNGGGDGDVDNGDGDQGDTTGNSGITGKYAGASQCRTCHIQNHTHWMETLHAEALDTLESIGQGSNANCVGCHTVGYGEAGGFVDRATTNDLSGVGCENCHGPAAEHVEDVANPSKRPTVTIASEMCGTCHTGSHHPHIDEWATSGHAVLDEHIADYFSTSGRLASCGVCHSGDYFVFAISNGDDVADDALVGTPIEDMATIECAVCHDPHMQTGNAAAPDDDRDFQLRYPEVANPTPSNKIADAINPDRFNLCGRCHHSRGRVWDEGSRGPHHSLQANVFTGEMPIPDGTEPLVANRTSAHALTTEQCATCHMFRKDYEDELAPTIAGHTFRVDESGCTAVGCHSSATQVGVAKQTLQTAVQNALEDIAARLGDPATWEYTSEGGPDAAGQAALPNEVKKSRFIYYYVLSDGSRGMHNPDYVRDLLDEADELLTSINR